MTTTLTTVPYCMPHPCMYFCRTKGKGTERDWPDSVARTSQRSKVAGRALLALFARRLLLILLGILSRRRRPRALLLPTPLRARAPLALSAPAATPPLLTILVPVITVPVTVSLTVPLTITVRVSVLFTPAARAARTITVPARRGRPAVEPPDRRGRVLGPLLTKEINIRETAAHMAKKIRT